jgi:hypothetical protein
MDQSFEPNSSIYREKILDIRYNIYNLRNTHLLPEVHYKRQLKKYLSFEKSEVKPNDKSK